MSTKTWATRLRVFRFIKRYADNTGVWPTSYEVGSELGIGQFRAQFHMRALEGAKGLPVVSRRRGGLNSAMRYWMGLGRSVTARGNGEIDPWRTPVDKLIA